MDRVPSRTERPSGIEPVTYGNYTLVGQAHNNGSSDNIQEIPVSIDNVRPGGAGYQSVTYTSGEALGRNYHEEAFQSHQKIFTEV